jgi:hypothetical protein
MPLFERSALDFSKPDTGQQLCASGTLPQDVINGIHAFNLGEYFEAHEFLETAWRDEPGPIRNLYRGILQVAVGYYHLLRDNQRGALKMFVRCREWLDPLPDICCGIQIRQFSQDVYSVEQFVQNHPEEHSRETHQALLKPIRMDHIIL